MHYSQNIFPSSSKKQEENDYLGQSNIIGKKDEILLRKEKDDQFKRKFIIYDPLQKDTDSSFKNHKFTKEKDEYAKNDVDPKQENASIKMHNQPCCELKEPKFNITDLQMKVSNKSNNLSTAPTTAKNSEKITTSSYQFDRNYHPFPIYPQYPAMSYFQIPTNNAYLYKNESLLQQHNYIDELCLSNKLDTFHLSPSNIAMTNPRCITNDDNSYKEQLYKNIKKQSNIINKDMNGDSIYSKNIISTHEKSLDPITNIVKQIEKNQIAEDYLINMDASKFYYFFSSLLPYIHRLMHNEFGNYFIQDLISYTDKKQRLKIWKLIKYDLESISKHAFASHCIQTLILSASESDNEEQKTICKYFNDHFYSLMEDAKGTHVLQKLLFNIKYSNKLFFVNLIYENFDSLVLNTKGVCLIKQLMASLVYEKSNKREAFLTLVLSNLTKYSQDKYGHYLILHMIDKWEKSDLEKLIMQIDKNLIDFACQVYSSRIVEKCVLAYKSVRLKAIYTI